MRILVISDTHGSDALAKKVIADESTAGKIDMLIHAGDVEEYNPEFLYRFSGAVEMVSGNCDSSGRFPMQAAFDVTKDHRVFLTHGHRFMVRTTRRILTEEARAHDCDIAVYGHTHVPFIGYEDGILVLNPGSLTFPHQADGRPTYILLTIDDRTGAMTPELKYAE